MRRALVVVTAAVVAVALLVVGFLVWAHTVFAGDREASLDAWRSEDIAIRAADGGFVIAPASGGSDLGMVFIPGAKVEPSAYLYKLGGIVEQTGMTIVVTHPTLNLAFFDTRPLEAFTGLEPGISRWLVGGHSLGGVRACQLADQAVDATDGAPEVAGLVFFGSYCANDVSGTDLAVLSLVGEHDGLSTPEKVAAASDLLPESAETVVIEGANHAAFGDYGPQPGDGIATADREVVRDELSAAVDGFLDASGLRG